MSLVSVVYVAIVQYVPARDMPNINIYKLLLRRFQEYQGSYCILNIALNLRIKES